jgi:hypothetical protein
MSSLAPTNFNLTLLKFYGLPHTQPPIESVYPRQVYQASTLTTVLSESPLSTYVSSRKEVTVVLRKGKERTSKGLRYSMYSLKQTAPSLPPLSL